MLMAQHWFVQKCAKCNDSNPTDILIWHVLQLYILPAMVIGKWVHFLSFVFLSRRSWSFDVNSIVAITIFSFLPDIQIQFPYICLILLRGPYWFKIWTVAWWHEAIIWSKADCFVNMTLTNTFQWSFIQMLRFSLKKMHFKLLFAKCCHFDQE